MPSVNLDLGYFDHPKTVRLELLLGRGAAVLPIRLWIYCARYHRKDGRLTAYTPETLEAALGWRGKPGSAVTGLLDCGAHIGRKGFLEQTDDGFRVHDWEEHQGHLEKYHEAAKVAANARWSRRSPPPESDRNADCNADRIPDCNADRNAPAGQGNALLPPPTPRWGAPSARAPRRIARALVGAHPPDEGPPLREVDQESPLWVIGVAKALGSPLRPVVPDGLMGDYQAWRRGPADEWNEEFEPEGWRAKLEAAFEEAAVEDRRMAGGGGR
jgi:hypothetical protein